MSKENENIESDNKVIKKKSAKKRKRKLTKEEIIINIL